MLFSFHVQSLGCTEVETERLISEVNELLLLLAEGLEQATASSVKGKAPHP